MAISRRYANLAAFSLPPLGGGLAAAAVVYAVDQPGRQSGLMAMRAPSEMRLLLPPVIVTTGVVAPPAPGAALVRP
jgi:hypothetical protein